MRWSERARRAHGVGEPSFDAPEIAAHGPKVIAVYALAELLSDDEAHLWPVAARLHFDPNATDPPDQ
jgi:hypothetical protein